MIELKSICVRRCHGLGNVVLLLPVLDHLHARGADVCLVTRKEWADSFAELRPEYTIVSEFHGSCIDLDEMTSDVSPNCHRSDEFARLLGLDCRIGSVRFDVPSSWVAPFRHLDGSVVFAPEAAHESRRWPVGYCNRVKELFARENVVVVGRLEKPAIECDADLRGQLDTRGLFGVISVSRVVVSMDSAVLHMAAALGKPTVAVFGGVDFRFRVRQDQPVVVMQAAMDCCPCNKNESCGKAYHCIKSVEPEHVLDAVSIAGRTNRLVDYYSVVGVR